MLIGLSGGPVTIVDSTTFSVFQREVRGHFGSEYADLPALIRLVEFGRIDPSASVSQVLPLADAVEAVRRLDARIGDPIRIVLRP